MEVNKPIRLCTVEGCGKVHRARGFCPNHYAVFRYSFIKRSPQEGPCIVEGCEKDKQIKKMCVKHYKDSLRYQRITTPELMHLKCKVEGCCIRVNAKGFCQRHYDRLKRIGSPLLTANKRLRNNFPVDFTIDAPGREKEMGVWFKKNLYQVE